MIFKYLLKIINFFYFYLKMKFGKIFLRLQIKEWANKYINYKRLKQIIKSINRKITVFNNNIISNDIIQETEEIKDPLLSNGQVDENKNNELFNNLKTEDLKEFFSNFDVENNNNIYHLYEFIQSLDEEFKKVYVFFIKQERELYIQINSLLYFKKNIKEEDIKNLLNTLLNAVYLAYKLKKYINSNLTAMIKILKKFDKKFGKLFEKNISNIYFNVKLNKANSDFDYFLKYKIIDEACIICEDILDIVIKKYYKEEFKKNIESVKQFLEYLDKNNSYQIKNKEFFSYEKNGNNLIKNNTEIFNKYILNPLIAANINNDSIFMIFNHHEKNFKKNYKMSNTNKNNVLFCCFLGFFMNFEKSLIFINFFNFFNDSKDYSFFHFFIFFSIFYLINMFSFLFLTNFYIKLIKENFILTIILLLFSNVFFFEIFNIINDLNKVYSLLLLYLSELFFIFHFNEISPRTYIVLYSSEYSISKISVYYNLSSNIGFCLGILFSILNYNYLYEKNFIDGFLNGKNITYFLGFIFCLIFLVLFLIFFTDSEAKSFKIFKNQSFIINISNLYSNANNSNKIKLISTQEKTMINEIDTKLDKYNKDSNFNDLNLIPNFIKEKIKIQKKHCSLFNNFILICLIYTFCFNYLNIQYIFLVIKQCFDIEYKLNSYNDIFLFIILTIFIIFYFIFQNRIIFNLKMNLKCFLAVLIFLNIALIIINIVLKSKNEKIVNYINIIIFGINLVLNSGNLIIIYHIFLNFLPSKWKIFKIKAEVLLNISINFGKIIGLLFLNFYFKYKDEKKYVDYILFGIMTFISISLEIIILFYNNFKEKALSRIIQNKIYENY